MFKKFVKELFKGCQKENSDGTDSIWGKDQTLLRKKKKTHTSLSKEQFLYQMDDGTQISKYLLEPAFLRELYLFELATTIALIRENMLTSTKNTQNGTGGGDLTLLQRFGMQKDRSKKSKMVARKQRLEQLSKQTYKDDIK